MKTVNNNFVFKELALELTNNILKFSENPSTAIPKIIDEIKELTRAKIVALYICPEDLSKNKRQKIELLYINPKRKKMELNEDILSEMIALVQKMKKITIISHDDNIKTYKKLNALGYNLSVLLPARIKDTIYGCFMILGLSAKVDLNSIVKGLESFTETFTLIYRYSMLYSKMEDFVIERTKDLKESEENLRITLNSIGDAVISTDMNGKIIHINPVALKLTGWKEKDAEGKSIEKVFKIINEKTRKKVENPVDRVLSEGTIIGLANHTLLISKNGKEIPIADSGSPIRNKDGEIFGVVLVFRDQTKEREAGKKLKESEQWNKEIFEGSRDAIFIVDSNAHFVDVNEAAVTLTGYSKEELLTMSIPDLHEDEDLEAYNNFFKSIIGGGSVLSEAKLCKKDGTKIDAEFSNSRIIIGGVTYMHTIARDITRRKQNENAIRSIATKFSAVSGLEFFEKVCRHLSETLQLDYAFVGELLPNENKVKVKAGIGKGRPIEQFNYDLANAPCKNVIRHTIQCYPSGVQNQFPKDYLLVEMNIESYAGIPLFSRSGDALGIMVLLDSKPMKDLEITKSLLQIFSERISVEMERLQVEEELKNSEEKYRDLFENSSDFLFTLDLKGNFTNVNQSAVKLTGFTKAELLKMNFIDYTPTNVKRKLLVELSNVFKTGKHLKDFPVEAIIKDKTVKFFETSFSPIKKGEKIIGFQGSSKDITERKKNEEKIKQKNKQLFLLSKASIEINKVLDIPTILRQLTKIAIELTGSTSGAAALYEGKKMVFKKYFNNGKITDINFNFEQGYGVPGWVIKTKKPYITNDAKNDKHVIKEIRERLNFHQLIDVPILNRQGELLGCFEIHNTKDNRPYDENDIEILKGLAAITSVAIENAQMILERKKADEILSLERDKFSFILNSLPIGVTVLDKDNKYTFINSISLEIDGYRGETKNLLGKDVKSNHPKNSFKEIDKLIKDFKSGKKSFHMRESIKGNRTVQISYNALHNSKGKYTGLIRLVTDITEMKEAENKIRESQQRLTSHLDNTPLGGIFWDINFKVTDWNKSAEKIFGYKKEEALGKHANELIVPKEIQPQIDDIFKNLLAQTGGTRSTNENITKNGKRILCDWYNVTLTDINGKVTGVAALVDDITERKKNEDELKKSEATFKLLLEKLPNAVFLTKLGGNNAGEIIYANPAAAKQTGYKKSKLIGMNIINDFYVEKTTVKLKEKRETDLKKGKTLSFIEKKKHADGTIYITQTMITPIDYENEKTTLSVNTDITKQFEAQEKIKESEDKYRSLFENNTAGVYVSTTAGKILDCNDAFVDMMGYSSKEEVLKTNANNFYENKEDREVYLKKLKEKKELLNFESKPRTKDGSYIYTIKNVQLIDENIIQGTVVDITERKNAEMELKALNEFNASLIETIPFGFDIVDMEGNILFMNNLLKDAIGIKNPKGKCWEFYKDNQKQCTECPLKGKMEIGEINICEVHNVLGGREFEITHTSMNYKNQKAMLEIFRDITEEKIAEKKIRQLSRGIEQSPEMIVITDIDGNIEYANPRVTEITGYTQEEIIGKNPKIFQAGKTPKSTYEELWETIIKGETWEGELLNKRKNGEEYWENERISPILNDKGETINYIGIKEDITEKIKARNELIEAKEKAEEMNKIKSNFFANMSHELRTPLVGILGFTEILNESIDDKDLKEYAGMINEAGQRLLETLNLILNLSKIESEHIQLEFSNVDVIKTIKETIKLFQIIADNKNLYIKLESDIKKLEIKIDERMLFQIVNNLVNNAVKFTKEGGITITVNLIKNNSYLEIQVKDTGIGIPKEKQEIIWQEFRQVSEGTARMFEGTGLGLTVTKEFTHRLGGEIKLKSKVGKGSIFTVLLPIIKDKETDESFKQITPPKIKNIKEIEESKKLIPILYLEDDKNARDIVTLFLRDICEVDLALNVEESIQKAASKNYDLFLVDINLKLEKGGIDFLNEVKNMEKYKETPLIAVTAYAMADDEGKFLDKGFTDYISKPFSKQDLIELIKRTIKEKN